MDGMKQQIVWYRSKRSNMAFSGATKMFLKKSTPKAASGLLSALPKMLLTNLMTMRNKNLNNAR
jgi:hypothetical protein